jgi:CheY-like chemotaxis protein
LLIPLKPILLVEDEPNDVEMTLLALAQVDLADQVMTLRDGADALDFFYYRGQFADRTRGLPVVVLLDNKMPKVDGLTLLRQIRSDEQLRLLPVVMLTSSRMEQDVIASYQLGINAYVVKPVGRESFVQAIQQLGLFWLLRNEPPPGSVRFEPRGE